MQKWQKIFLALYGFLTVVCLATGNFAFALAYLAITLFFALPTIDLDLFAPAALMVHAFGLYFLPPLALLRDHRQETVWYITGTLICTLVLYVLLPRLNFGQAKWLGEKRHLRKTFRRTCIVMVVLGYIGFIASTRLAGYSSPLGVFTNPIDYRFFMLAKGMTYVSELLGFLITTPAIATALAYYMGFISRTTFAGMTLVAIFYNLATGSRGAVIFIVVMILIIRHIFHKQVAATIVLVTACIAIPFVAIAGEYRMVKYTEESGTLSSILSKLTVEDVLELAASRMDAAAMFDELMHVYHGDDPHLGMSYLAIPIQVIPRGFWPTKPRLPNPEMTRIIGRDDPYLDIAFDFGIFGETYINFLWFGMLGGALIVVCIVGPLQFIFEYAKAKRDPLCTLACCLLFLVPIEIVVSGLAQVIATGSFSVIQVLAARSLFFKKVL